MEKKVNLKELFGELYTAQEVADYIGVDKINLYKKIKTGKIKGIKIGRDWKFTAQEVKDYLERCKSGSDDTASLENNQH